MEHSTKSPSDQQRPGGATRRPAAASAAATLVDNRPAAVAQRELADAIIDSPRVIAQRASLRAAVLSPRVIAQGKRLEGMFGNAAQRRSDPADVSSRRISGQVSVGHVPQPRTPRLVVQRWPTKLPISTDKTQEFDSLEQYFRFLAQLQPDTSPTVAEALLKYLFPWNPKEPYDLQIADVPKASELQKDLGIKQGDWTGLVFEGRTRKLGSPRDKPFIKPTETKLDPGPIVKTVNERINKANDPKPQFRLLYDEKELLGLVMHAASLGIDDTECVEIILIGCRILKPRSAEQLKDQMHNLKIVVEKRGYPFKFDTPPKDVEPADYFSTFSTRLIGLVRDMTLFNLKVPADDIRIQGSSLRTELAEDVDIAVIVSPEKFGMLCVNRYKVKDKDESRVKKKVLKAQPVAVVMPTTYDELVALAKLIRQNSKEYNIEAGSFADMLLGGKFDGKTKSTDTALFDLTKTIADEYTPLNIESVTIIVKGGPFDLKPFLQLH